MKTAPARMTLRSAAGFALIEVVVSALIMATVTGGVIRLVSATGKSGAEERHRSQAYAVAQEEQSRLRSTRIADLATAIKPREVTLNGTTYTITSTATSVSDKTSTTTCGTGARADYVKLSSEVTWTGMRATAIAPKIESIVSPVSGSLDPTAGNLSVTVNNASIPPVPISGVDLTGSGPGSFSGSTDSNGCALFGGQPAGNYTLTPKLGSEYVDANGQVPSSQTVGITGGTTTPIVLEYDKKGTVELKFTARGSDGVVRASSADAVTASATGLTLTGGLKKFGTPGGPPTPSVSATPLYPFSYSYYFYAGSCETNKPEAGQGVSVKAPAGGPPASAELQLPALYLTVKNASGTALSGARVTAVDTQCSVGSTPVKRPYTTNSTGNLPDPGLTWSTYNLCASATVNGRVRQVTKAAQAVKSLTGTTLVMTIANNATEGACP